MNSLIFHSDKQVLKESCDKMDENDVQPANEVFISSGKKETSSKTETSKITESNVELKSLSDYGENGNNLDGKCYKIRYKFGKGAFTIYQFGCGISKMVGPKKQAFCPRINNLKGTTYNFQSF